MPTDSRRRKPSGDRGGRGPQAVDCLAPAVGSIGEPAVGGFDAGIDFAREAAELGLDDALGRNLLAGLRRDPPPRYDVARAQAAALAARWEAGETPLPAPAPARARSPKTSAPAAVASSVGAVASSALRRGSAGSLPRARSCSQGPSVSPGNAFGRPPLLGPSRLRGVSPRPGQPISLVQLPSLSNAPHEQQQQQEEQQRQQQPQHPKQAQDLTSDVVDNVEDHESNEDSLLMSKMAARLAQVERLNQQLSAKLTEKTQEVEALRTEVEALKRVPNDGSGADGENPGEALLRAERDELKRNVEAMQKFLQDYGLTWVPRTEDDIADRPKSQATDAAVLAAASKVARDGSIAERLGRPPQSALPRASTDCSSVAVDIGVIRSRVESLNALVEEEDDARGGTPPGVSRVGKGTEKNPRELALVPLTFFCDGVKAGERAFMSYELRPCQALIKDILDGFFPRALKDDFPNGVKMHVVDRTGNAFATWFRDFARNDPELADGGERLRPHRGHAIHAPMDAQSAEERFVSKLPEHVVTKSGQICNVRGAVAEKLGLRPSGASSVGSVAVVGDAAAKSEEVMLLDAGREASKPSTRLQVKLETGHRVKLCMEMHATVGDVWNALEAWRKSNGVVRAGSDGRQCTLRTAFPPREYTDTRQTLEAAGLTPSATLFISCDAGTERT
eukprot:TRINITY_DN61177_c0_g1_i1.p1 TRINITY_DN61177_c0_g1~~TRINITY_DN61177_c0_g1_i1.p1  ORF type:complete len:677 (+),score=108.17 TRINITY_DN61177_c0_g1_i1:88-2118(+)